jgi:hypothetical protein
VLLHHFRNATNSEEVIPLLENIYMDDLASSHDTVREARDVRGKLKRYLQGAKMDMRKWCINDSTVNQEYAHEEATPPVKQSKVLGLPWDVENDSLGYEVSELERLAVELKPTKRTVLRISSRLFDPLGLLSPYTIRAKAMLQHTWIEGLEWDAELPEELASEWNKWVKELHHVGSSEMVFTRCISGRSGVTKSRELHTFCDASKDGFGVAIYIRNVLEDGTFQVILVAGKGRVSPLKPQLTIPRLELCAALLGARMTRQILDSINISIQSIYYWTDSVDTLCWIRQNPSMQKIFIANRVSEIQELSQPANWRHVPGKLNPADLASRGVAAEKLSDKEGLWQRGPGFLSQRGEDWPQRFQASECPQNQEELVVVAMSKKPNIVDMSRFRKLNRLLRSLVYVKRALTKRNPSLPAPKTLINVKTFPFPLRQITSEELATAKTMAVRMAQEEHYYEEIAAIAQRGTVGERSTLAELRPFIDKQGIIRSMGRMQSLDLPFEQKYPVVLPAGHYLTKLIMADIHFKLGHCTIVSMLMSFRNEYFAPRARQLATSIAHQCPVCRKFRVRPMVPDLAPVPDFRVEQTKPFLYTGIDYAGPVLIKASDGQPQKSWIIIFTCAVTRAVDLQLATALSTQCFMFGLRKFLARWGKVKMIVSDHGTQLKRAAMDLKELYRLSRSDLVQEHVANEGIEWKFTTEKASWQGGIYERLIRIIKDSLRRTLGRALLSYEHMDTVLQEIVACVNSRPLTYVSGKLDEEPLSPLRLITGFDSTCLPAEKLAIGTPARQDILSRFAYRHQLVNQYWRRFSKEYITELRNFRYNKTPSGTQPKLDDVVLIVEEKQPRLSWKMGRIVEVKPGRDNVVRTVRVQVNTYDRNKDRVVTRMYYRPVNLICPLEI